MAINSLTDFIIRTGQPSGPGDFPLCIKSISFPKTTPGLKLIESRTAREQSAESTVGVKVLSSTVKTLEK